MTNSLSVFKLKSGIQKDQIVTRSIQACRLKNGNIDITIDQRQTSPGREIIEIIELTQEEAEHFSSVLSSLLASNGQVSPTAGMILLILEYFKNASQTLKIINQKAAPDVRWTQWLGVLILKCTIYLINFETDL